MTMKITVLQDRKLYDEVMETNEPQTHISDFFILKMFTGRRKSAIESEKSSDGEVVSFRRRVINKVSSGSDLDMEEPYASEDLDDMLEELALDEEEELNSVDNSLDNVLWKEFANRSTYCNRRGNGSLEVTTNI
ncbi:uncharacterized protein LOC116433734 [Nomia melanderi]|uniref:uncharacterized protein LOC116433734 n=1 Tax=Nomia melanderi TaxID=2448451 RepID=UPI001304747D|nr:uncharacterized protein LOC116433734 [Nomia melanderi]